MTNLEALEPRRTLRKLVEDSLPVWMLSLLLVGFLAGYKVNKELRGDREVEAAEVSEATPPSRDGLRATNVKDRFIVVVKSLREKGDAQREATSMWANGLDPRIYEANNEMFAIGFSAPSMKHAESLRRELVRDSLADGGAYVSAGANFRARWLFGL